MGQKDKVSILYEDNVRCNETGYAYVKVKVEFQSSTRITFAATNRALASCGK